MKLFTAIILSLSILSGTLVQTYHLGKYELQKEYYKKVLCINKNVKNSGCNGQCALSKELNRSETPQNEEQITIIDLNIIGYLPQGLPMHGLSVIPLTKHINPFNFTSRIKESPDSPPPIV